MVLLSLRVHGSLLQREWETRTVCHLEEPSPPSSEQPLSSLFHGCVGGRRTAQPPEAEFADSLGQSPLCPGLTPGLCDFG